jgi:hypothetical protein
MYKAEMRTASGAEYTAYADTPYDALTALLEDGHDWRQVKIKPAKLGERLRRQEATNENN